MKRAHGNPEQAIGVRIHSLPQADFRDPALCRNCARGIPRDRNTVILPVSLPPPGRAGPAEKQVYILIRKP